MQTRRQFITAIAGGIPVFLSRSLVAADQPDDGRILVVLELSGGNDGINTVVPFRDHGYRKHRRSLRLPTDSLIRVNDELGLHPSLRALAEVFQHGNIQIRRLFAKQWFQSNNGAIVLQ